MIDLIPAIDIIDGKCVRLTKGDYARKKVYGDSPVDVAKDFERHGFKRLHIVDLDGAKSQHVVNIDVLKAITASTNLKVDFGGGIKSEEDVRKVFEAGVSFATIGSLAVTNQQLFLSWIEKFGSDKFILGADINHGKISINGWKEESEQTLEEFLHFYIAKGIRHVLCTDIAKDGTLEGPAVQLYQDILAIYPDIDLIASGGISCVQDFRDLENAGVPSVVFGKAFYEGKITWEELEQFIKMIK